MLQNETSSFQNLITSDDPIKECKKLLGSIYVTNDTAQSVFISEFL